MSEDSVRLSGHVKFYDSTKRFGFVSVKSDGKAVDYHFQQRCMRNRAVKVSNGVMVEFTPVKVETPHRRDKATDIVVVG